MKIKAVRIVKWERLHFCKDDRIRYRKHLTCGMLVATGMAIGGTAFGVDWLVHTASLANMGTAIMWIWE